MTTIFVRGSNPIWSLVDLTGHQFDDTFYMFVLENTIPYIPSTVYTDVSGTIPWTNPIQFLANGTLPVDIYWDPDLVYRLEFRQGPTQNDPLIYEVNNYSPGGGGDIPVDTASVTTDNQITNPQFSLLSFNPPFSLVNVTDPDPIEVAPGWFLNLTGTGNVTLDRVAITSTQQNETNAPYALRITLSGSWSSSPYLSQRFNENGMLWSTFLQDRYVANSVTARIEGSPQAISAQLYDSMGTVLTTVLDSTPINSTYNEYLGTGLMPVSTNTDTPPAAWIEYRLFLPTNVDISVTSFQLISSLSIETFEYLQETIERQQDHTFHYYRNSLLREEKNTILTGWDFGQNPWQFVSNAPTNLATFGYTADQTILFARSYITSATGNTIAYGQAGTDQNSGYAVTAVTASNQFAMVQYIDPRDIRSGWGKIFSSMVKLKATLQATTVGVKMRLIYRQTLPSPISQTEPIISWAVSDTPVFGAGWSELAPKNDPVYILTNGDNTLLFEGFELPVATPSLGTWTLGVVLYSTDNMIETGTADNIVFNSVSLVQNEFAIDVPSFTFDETLRRCQFYGQKSFLIGTVPAQNAGVNTGESLSLQTAAAGALQIASIVRFATPMRATPTIVTFNPAAANNLPRNETTGANWSGVAIIGDSENGFAVQSTSDVGSGTGNLIGIHWTAKAFLGT